VATTSAPARRRPVRQDATLTQLAPAMVAAIEAAEHACREAGLPVLRFETFRSAARQEWLYAQGREVIPPNAIVTKARSAVRSWHGYGLAVDFIHPTKFWNAPRQWWREVAAIIVPCGLTWGGDWPTLPDVPHYQWGGCPIAPRAVDREAYARGDLAAVWARYGAAA
jgi:hypothetical protein